MKGKIGPHEDRELELMLSGQKDIALFFRDNPDYDRLLADFKRYGFSIEKVVLRAEPLHEAAVIYRSDRLEKAERFIALLFQAQNGFRIDVERESGLSLGYTVRDVEYYSSTFPPVVAKSMKIRNANDKYIV